MFKGFSMSIYNQILYVQLCSAAVSLTSLVVFGQVCCASARKVHIHVASLPKFSVLTLRAKLLQQCGMTADTRCVGKAVAYCTRAGKLRCVREQLTCLWCVAHASVGVLV